MTFPGAPGSRGPNPFDFAAAEAARAVQARLAAPRHPYPPPLSEAEQEQAQKAASDAAKVCRYCIGIHDQPNTPGCPRLASFKLDGDGKVTEGTYWPGTDWAQGRVIFTEDAHEQQEDGDGG